MGVNAEATRVEEPSARYLVGVQGNEVPPGYRRTEVGLLPSEWELVRIDAHASIRTGARNTQDKRDDGAYPFFVRSQQVERIDSYSYDGEAVLTAGDGAGTGKVFHYINGRFDVHQRVYRISGFSDRLVGRYFFYQFSTRFFDRIMSMTAKSSVDSVRMEMIAGMQIPLPAPPEQRAIAEALSDVDELLGALDALIAKKRAIKQAAMQQLLTGKTRLPGFSGEWKTKRLGELLAVCHGRNQRGIEAPDGPYPILASGGRIGNAARPLYDKPSVLIGRKGTIDRPQYIDKPFWTVDTLFYTTMKGSNVARFFYYRFCLIDWTQYNEASGVPSLNARTIEQIEIECPMPEEQAAVSAVLADFDSDIAAIETRRDKTRAIKQGMTQQLLTGRIRLVKPAAQTELAC